MFVVNGFELQYSVMGEERGVYRVLVGKPEGKRPLGRPRHRWVDNIRMDLQEVGCGYMDWPRIGTGGGPLHRKCSKGYSAYFDKTETCCTQEKYSKKQWETVAFALGWRVESD